MLISTNAKMILSFQYYYVKNGFGTLRITADVICRKAMNFWLIRDSGDFIIQD